MAETQSLRSHLMTELRDLLDAEQQLTRVLPDFASRATSPALRTAFEAHLKETNTHIARLKQAFAALGESPQPKRCEGMQGLIREGGSVVNSTPEGALRDAVMITSAQKVEHYEMASYGTARTYATVLGEPAVATLLEDTLQEEKAADAKLTEIAESKVNGKAAEEWHTEAAGLLEQTATLAGKAIGVTARTVRRAVDAASFGPAARRHGGDPRVLAQASSSVSEAMNAAGEIASDAAKTVRDKARRIVKSSSAPTKNASKAQRASRNNSSRKATRRRRSKKR